MSREEGTIIEVLGDNARVRIRRSSMCNACNCRNTCSTLGGGETMEAEAINTASGKEGDRVLLEIPTKSLWKISFIFYMLPVIFLISGVIVGMKLAGTYSLEPELGGLLLGVLGCAFSLLIIKVFANRVKKRRDYIPEIIKIL